MKEINSCVCEIRYKPNSKVLDYRGTWAEMISKHLQLPDWKIIENRLDVYDNKSMEQAFVGFRQMGMACNNAPTKNYFPEKVNKLISFVMKLDGFGASIHVERIGIRIRFCSDIDKKFSDLKDLYLSKYVNINADAKKTINAELVDTGINLNFKDSIGSFNTISGPMEKAQIQQFFENRKPEEIPEVGLYYDVDYFINPDKVLSSQDVINDVKKLGEGCWQRFEEIKGIIGK
ncbi:MAG: hypothetical protein A2452_07360 [Candidatus Firestonebacteria bacterium RIFOXYC2_FULL_39_67]|nr:MAG: hypothetical protein A2452_07360 [Candidatus Firestonebacteria bacterium RIFOXYC2_FULL_39_67]